jgi:glycogen debranching enzyme
LYLFFYGRYIQLAAGSPALAILGTGSDETYMIRIANLLGENVQEINEWMSRTKINFYKYFLPNGGEGLGTTEEALFCSYDLLSKDWIRKRTISSLVPIFTGLVSKEEIDILVKWVTHSHWCGWEGRCHSPVLPSADLEEPYFRPLTYWRGPVWVNANWMIWLGLLKYGYKHSSQ